MRTRAMVATLHLLAAVTALLAAPAAAQVMVVDEGTFSLLVRGARSGREDFSIRRTTGGGIVAQANLLQADARSTVVVNTDSTGGPERFRIETIRAGRTEEEVSGERRGTLWSGLATHPSGERGKEFRLPEGGTIADDAVVHHLWFVVRFAREHPTGRLLPRLLAKDTVTVEDAGSDRVTIGLDEIDARKLIVRSSDPQRPLREVWVDAEGRLLRVRVPAQEFEAIRDELPRETPDVSMAYDDAVLLSFHK